MKISSIKYWAIFLAFLELTSCSQKKISEEIQAQESVVGSDINLKKLSESLNIILVGSSKDKLDSFKNVVPKTRRDLEDMRTVIKMYDGNTGGSITIPGFGGLILGKNEKSLSVYYIETKTVVIGNNTSVYGIGYSINYLFKKVKKGINVDKLPLVAASVQLDGNKTEVFYSIQSFGISGGELAKFFKPVINKPFDVEGFGIMQSSIDGIHNVLSDSLLSKQVLYRPELFRNITPADLQ